MKSFSFQNAVSFLKGKWYLILIGLLGILLILFSGSGTGEKKDSARLDPEIYRAELTAAVEALCERTAGVGDATVLLTLATGEYAVYEKNLTESSESVALSGGDALLLAYAYPAVSGVAVVCSGGDSESVKRELTMLLSRALALPTTKIHIAGAK